jgi:hypothetical protein
LSSLDSGNVASNATTDDNEIFLLYISNFESAGCTGLYSDELGGNIPAAEAYPRLHRDSEGEATTLGSVDLWKAGRAIARDIKRLESMMGIVWKCNWGHTDCGEWKGEDEVEKVDERQG